MIPEPVDSAVLMGRVRVPQDHSEGVVVRWREDESQARAPSDREWRTTVKFPGGHQYRRRPSVEVAIAEIDANTDRFLRLETRACEIETSGFELVVRVWQDTRLYGLTLLWIATPRVPSES